MLSYGKQSLDGTIFLYGPFFLWQGASGLGLQKIYTFYATIMRTRGLIRIERVP